MTIYTEKVVGKAKVNTVTSNYSQEIFQNKKKKQLVAQGVFSNIANFRTKILLYFTGYLEFLHCMKFLIHLIRVFMLSP
jgi:hypothetical protein